jgi:hypothetical protein
MIYYYLSSMMVTINDNHTIYIYSYYHCVDPQTSSSPACNMPCRWRVLCPSAAKIYAIIRQSPNWQNSIQLQQLRTLLKR